MADSLPDSKGGTEAGAAEVAGASEVVQAEGVAGDKVDRPSMVLCGEDAQQQEEALLSQSVDAAHSSDQQNECGGITLEAAGMGGVLPAEEEGGGTENRAEVQNDTENTNSGLLETQGDITHGCSESELVNMASAEVGSKETGKAVMDQNNSEATISDSSQVHRDLLEGCGMAEAEVGSVSQAKDPPDRDSCHEGAAEPLPSPAAGSVSAKSLLTSPDSSSKLPDSDQSALEEPTSDLPAPEPAGSTEGCAVSAMLDGSSAGHCQAAVTDLSQPHSLPVEQSSSLGLDSQSSASGSESLQVTVNALAFPKATTSLPPVPAEAAGSVSQSSEMSLEPEGSDSSSAVADVLSSSAPEEGEKMVVAASGRQSEVGGSEVQLGNSEDGCLEESITDMETEEQPSLTDANAAAVCTMNDGEETRMETETIDEPQTVTAEGEADVEHTENWNDRNFTCEADTETGDLPMIVAAHSLSQEHDAEKEPNKEVEDASAAEVCGGGEKVVPLLGSEPLRPVTIGSSLQPLEEVQEATAAEEASPFATDLAIIDSSADEADSIGGLVINNVIGAADGVVDFQPDEAEAEKELMDISSSAPQLGDATDDGPSAKRRRLENGLSTDEDKVEEGRQVVLKVVPVKNGHGPWDTQKLQELLLAKGTILLQIHASKECLQLAEADKTDTDKTVDFTAIMTAAKDDDHDPGLPCGNSGDPDTDDPLAVSSSPETNTHTSFPHSFPPSRGRSTALQPAMPPRPTFKHLQTPQHYYMKSEVLGLPPPLEFEDPQGGADMSGGVAKSTSIATTKPSYRQTRVDKRKTCEVCGSDYWYPTEQRQHLHDVMYNCKKCPFATRNMQAYDKHAVTHQIECTVCFEVFSSPITHALHMRRIHGLYICKLCEAEFPSKAEWSSHMKQHNDKPKAVTEKLVAYAPKPPETYQPQIHSKLMDGKQQLIILPNQEFLAKITQASNASSAPNQQILIRALPRIVPKSSPGAIITTSEAINLRQASVEPAVPAFVTPQQPYPLGNPYESDVITSDIISVASSANSSDNQATPTSLPNPKVQSVFIKDEPMEAGCSKPNTVLVKLKAKRKRGPKPHLVMLPCELCSTEFRNLTALRIHMKQKHTEKPKCPLCHVTKSTQRKVYQHQVAAHKDKLRCHHFCLALFDTRQELSAHHINVHNKDDTLGTCRYCRGSYSKGEYLKHLQKCDGEVKSKLVKQCATCMRRFTDPSEYSEHIETCAPRELKYKRKVEEIMMPVTAMLKDAPESKTVKKDILDVDSRDVSSDKDRETSDTMDKETSSAKDKKPNSAKDRETSIVRDEEMIGTVDEETSSAMDKESTGTMDDEEDVSTSDVEVIISTDNSEVMRCMACRKVVGTEETGIDHVIKNHRAVLSHVNEYKICELCGKLFVSGLALCKHLLEHYDWDGTFEKILPEQFIAEYTKSRCWVCKTQGISYTDYHRENRNLVIDRIFSGLDSMNSATDENYSSYCCLCEESFTKKHDYWKHIKIHLTRSVIVIEESQQLICPKCEYRCSVRSKLVEHIASHFVQFYYVSEALNSSSTAGDMDNKVGCAVEVDDSSHSGGTFECSECQSKFNIESEALNHILSDHKKILEETISYKKCSLCDRSFLRAISYCCHLLKHYTDLGLWDEMVPRDLLSHVNLETVKRYCWVCKVTFAHKMQQHQYRRNKQIDTTLQTRISELEEDTEIQCPLCDFSCTNRYTHWKHVKLHLFLSKSTIKVDTEPEVAEPPTVTEDLENTKFHCLRCDRRFDGIVDFRKHLATHFLRPCKTRKKRPRKTISKVNMGVNKMKMMTLRSKSGKSKTSNIKCVSCQKTFRSSTDAMTHVLSVHKNKILDSRLNKLECSLCNVSFKGEWWLCRHMINDYVKMEMWDNLVPRDLASKLNARNKCWVCKCVLNKNYTAHTSKRNSYISVMLAANCNQNDIPFDCSVCNQDFPTRPQYWQHMMLHLCKPPLEYTAERETVPGKKEENICSYCSVLLPDDEALNDHLALHFLKYEDDYDDSRQLMEIQLSDDDTTMVEGYKSGNEDDEWLPPNVAKKQENSTTTSEGNSESNGAAVVDDSVPIEVTNDDTSSSSEGE